MEQAQFEIDDLTVAPYTLEMKARHESPRWYNAKAVRWNVQAVITVRHYGDYQYPGGYILEERIDRVNSLAPGAMGKRQEERARVLLATLRDQVREALLAANWVPRWKTSHGVDLWFYVGNQAAPSAPTSKASRVLYVPAREKVTGYSRTITASEVTYTCERCHNQVTRPVYPGAAPRYCEDCALQVEREKTRERVARYRAAKRAGKQVS